jgi:hypothetical protein
MGQFIPDLTLNILMYNVIFKESYDDIINLCRLFSNSIFAKYFI